MIGRACSQAPESLTLAARSLARSNSSVAPTCRASATLVALLSSQFFPLAAPAPFGGVVSWPSDYFSSAVPAEGAGRSLWDVGRIAETRSAVAAVDDKYAEGAKWVARLTPKPPCLTGRVACSHAFSF